MKKLLKLLFLCLIWSVNAFAYEDVACNEPKCEKKYNNFTVTKYLEANEKTANLGCVETVVGPPVTTSHVECTAEERKAAGIPEGLVRYSTGIEDVEDLIADLEQALKVII
ncbi:PLP-dependent transferase [Candidatus Pelagibacter ubique]|nr:PLP-dependent transferase [Candidatus Pelagibacter ubique]